MNGFADWLREEMRTAGRSQRELAALSGVDHSTISRILDGNRAPLYETARRLAAALGYRIILTRSDLLYVPGRTRRRISPGWWIVALVSGSAVWLLAAYGLLSLLGVIP